MFLSVIPRAIASAIVEHMKSNVTTPCIKIFTLLVHFSANIMSETTSTLYLGFKNDQFKNETNLILIFYNFFGTRAKTRFAALKAIHKTASSSTLYPFVILLAWLSNIKRLQ